MKTSSLFRAVVLLGLAASLHPVAHSQVVVNDTLNGSKSTYSWKALNGACLTAGNNTGSIPACVGLPYYSGKTQVGGATGRLPDTATGLTTGNGALRLTNGDTTTGSNGDNQTGAVVSTDTFPTNQGLQVTFKTVTYGGDGLGNSSGAGSGADGISFFLSDGDKAGPTVGGLGGSLGYSCSNGNSTYDGVSYGYLGVGIDEYGNFSNKGDNTNTGATTNQTPGRIVLRGAGNTNWAALNALNSTYYPSSLSASTRQEAVQRTCRDGKLWNYSSGTGVSTNTALAFNYPYITAAALPVTIYSQEATNMPTRGAATPITYSLKLTQDGYLDFSFSINNGTAVPLLTHTLITDSNGPLPNSFRFGFSAGTGGGSNVHEITCFKAAPAALANSSASTNVQQTGRLQQGAQVYFGYYHPLNSWGELTATSLLADDSGNLSLSQYANWDASCVLTGGDCPATNATATIAQTPASRAMLTWSGSAGVPFQWGNLTNAQQTALGSTARLSYLRGVRTGEIGNTGGTFRTRTGVLGDIIDSGPTWVGGAVSPQFAISWKDSRYSAATPAEPDGSYASYITAKASRQNVVYVGANDGFLHGFRTGNTDGTGTNDGNEVLAYMPGAIVSTIHPTDPVYDFSGTQYSHNYYVDATPGVGDLYYAGAWHTWLVGGAGYGGNAAPVGDNSTTANGVLFGLDVTDPTRFSESNASSLVLGEWTTANLSCVSNGGCGSSLGSSVGTPIIRRLHNGSWAVLFGNGLNSASGKAGLYIMLVDPSSGARTFRFLDTGVGASGTIKNGIAYVAASDLDGDHITDYVYAGDVLGNLWRFDLTSADPSAWAAGATPLYSTGSGQPITTVVIGAAVPGATAGDMPRQVVSFGTGRQFPQTLTSGVTYAPGAQALYGIWDWNMDAWNASAPTGSKYATLTAPQTITSSKLVTQTLTTVANSGTAQVSGGFQTESNNAVCWTGTSGCTGTLGKFGWTVPLLGGAEIVFNPTFANGAFLVNTTIPSVSQNLSCDVQPASGFTMAISVSNGSAGTSFFSGTDGNPLTSNNVAVVSLGLSGTGSPAIVTVKTASGKTVTSGVTQTVSTTPSFFVITPHQTGPGNRVNWKQLR